MVVGHHLVLGVEALPVGVDQRRRLAQVGGTLGRGDHAGHGAVGLEAVVEQAQGLGDPAGGHVVVARHRLGVHLGRRVAVGVLAEGDGDVGQVVAGGAVLVHVPAGQHGDLIDRPQQPPRP